MSKDADKLPATDEVAEVVEEVHRELIDQSGLRELRSAVAGARRGLAGGRSYVRDVLAAVNTAMANVPDGMANAVIVGVNPIHGLYATIIGPIVGGTVASSQLMVITTTAAASLTAGQSLIEVPAEDRASALFLMVILVGVFQVVFGLLDFGRFMRFVSYSVSVGLLTGIAVLLIVSQLSTVSGYETEGPNRISEVFDFIVHVGDIHLLSLAVAALTFALAYFLPRTPIGQVGRIVAIVTPSFLMAAIGWDDVLLLEDIGAIQGGVPRPSLPEVGYLLSIITGALSLAIIILVQGAGVSQSVPNPDGTRTDMSRDFVAQGAANVTSGFFRGLPVGGSMSATAVSVVGGANSRWAAILAGLGMAVIVAGFADTVSQIAMPALGALLILAGVNSIKPADFAAVSNAGWPSVLAAVVTFLAMLFLPIQVAVAMGVVLSAFLYLTKSASDISVVELVERSDGRLEEHSSPSQLPSDKVTVLDVYGNLFYAGARTLERMLPDPDADHAAVVLRLRGRTSYGATLVDVLSNYAERLGKRGGRLYLSGISGEAFKQVSKNGKLRLDGPVRAFPATDIRGESTSQAFEDAQAWLVEAIPDSDSNSKSRSNGDGKERERESE